ncbi:MAG: sensor histidine kinase [Bacteroidota bacterium]
MNIKCIKIYLIILCLCCKVPFQLYATNQIDSLLKQYKYAQDDTNKINLSNTLCKEYRNVGKYDTAIYYGNNALQLAKKLNYFYGIANSYNNIGIIYDYQSNYSQALENHFASLKIRKETDDKKGMGDSYCNIGLAYSAQDKYDKALEYHFTSLKIRKQTGDKLGIANSYNNIGLVYYNQGIYGKALENYFASLKIKEEIGDKRGIANSHNNIGLIYYNQTIYEKALENHFASLKIREQINDKYGIAHSYNDIGNIYSIQGKYEKALEFFFNAIKIQKEIGNKKGVSDSYNNIGNIYYHQILMPGKNEDTTKLKKALENYFASLKIKREINDKRGMAKAYNNIGMIYFIQGKFQKALRNYFVSLKVKEEIGDKEGIASSYYNIGNIYLKNLKYVEAKQWLQKGAQLAQEIGAKGILMSSYERLSEASEKTNDFKNAYKYHQLYSSFRDSIFNKESSKQIAEMETKYETKKKELQIISLNNENKIKVLEIAEQQHQLFKHKILFAALIVGIVLITVISWLLISRNRIRQKEILKTEHLKQQVLRTKAIIETQEQERKRIAQDLHDGIGQTLAAMKMNISSKTKFVSEENQKILQQIVVSIDSAHKEVRTLSHSMMPKALNESGLEDAIDDLLEKILANSTIKCIFEKDSAIRFDENTEIGLYRVFQELINNILKHANASEIAVHLHKTKTQIILMVEDNGMGIKQKQLGEKKGMGLSNIETRVHALNGTFSISAGTHQGTIAVVRIPTNNNQSITIV